MNRGFIVTQKYSTAERHMGISEHWNPENFLLSGWKQIILSPTKVQTDEDLFGLETPLEKS